MRLKISKDLKKRFPSLKAEIIIFGGIIVQKENPELEAYKKEVFSEIKKQWTLDKLREYPQFRAYRDFFWKLGIDPTKTRPSSEALIRRILRSKPLIKINTLVDAYNIVSIKAAIPIASFDKCSIMGNLYMREAIPGEKFLGIAMKKQLVLKGGEAIIEDDEKLVAIYPYRDADSSKITLDTNDVIMLMCGAPGIERTKLTNTGILLEKIITRFCSGKKL